MELLEFIRFFRRYGFAVLFFALSLGVVSGLISLKLPSSFEASQSLFAGRQPPPPSSNFYSYDGYYSQQAAERFTDTVLGLLKNKDVLSKAAAESGWVATPEDIVKLNSRLKVKRIAPQLITISFTDIRKERAVSLVGSLTRAVINLSTSLNVQGDKLLVLNTLETNPFVEEKRFSPLIVSLFVTLVSLMVGSFFFAFIKLLKETSGRK